MKTEGFINVTEREREAKSICRSKNKELVKKIFRSRFIRKQVKEFYHGIENQKKRTETTK